MRDERGELALVELSPIEHRRLRTWRIGAYTWAHPALDGRHLVFRDGGDLVALGVPRGADSS